MQIRAFTVRVLYLSLKFTCVTRNLVTTSNAVSLGNAFAGIF